MATEETDDAESAKKGGKKGLIIGLVLALAGGGAGFAFTSGMLSGGSDKGEKSYEDSKDVAFIPLDPLTVQIRDDSATRYLRFTAQLEVKSAAADSVKKLTPRVVDVINTYLQSVSLRDVEDPSALLTLRSQMRRRIDLVVGDGKVHDLLVMEFVVN